ncbi:MAG: CBS domain-containing protein, partial [Ilumatobacteraceae bacterium]
LGLAKLLAWWVALASGTSGGTVAPLLLISGSFGTLVGAGVNHLAPGIGVTPGAFGLVAMAATFGAAVGATFTAIVFLFELTRDYQVILPLMLASVLAELVASALMDDTLMTEKLSRHGLHVQGDYAIDALAGTSVREVMTEDVQTISEAATVADARLLLDEGHHSAFPVVDGSGRCVAIVAREDLLVEDHDPDAPVATIASRDVIEVSPDDTVLEALEVILREEVGHLPVVDGGRLVGLLTRTDVLRARSRQLELEKRQPGFRLRVWRSRLRPSRPTPASPSARPGGTPNSTSG